jgi:hypothetical protein
MKKFLLGSISLMLLSVSIIVFQISCQKSATAQAGNYTLPPATNSTLGGVIVGSGLNITSTGVLSVTGTSGTVIQLNKIIFSKLLYSSSGSYLGVEVWTANYDGTAQTKVNISLPSGIVFSEGMTPKLSPNGQKVFFTAGPPLSSGSTIAGVTSMYSCNIDGSNILKIIDGVSTSQIGEVGGAY